MHAVELLRTAEPVAAETLSVSPGVVVRGRRATVRRVLLRTCAVVGFSAVAWSAASANSTAHADGLGSVLGSLTDAGSAVVEPIANNAGPLLTPLTPLAAPAVEAAVAPVAQAASPVIQAAQPAVAVVAAPVVQAAQPVVAAVVAPVVQVIVTPVVRAAQPVAEAVVAPVVRAAVPAVQAVAVPVAEVVAPVVEAVAPVVGAVGPPAQATVAPLAATVTAVVGNATPLTQTALSLSRLVPAIARSITPVVDPIAELTDMHAPATGDLVGTTVPSGVGPIPTSVVGAASIALHSGIRAHTGQLEIDGISESAGSFTRAAAIDGALASRAAVAAHPTDRAAASPTTTPAGIPAAPSPIPSVPTPTTPVDFRTSSGAAAGSGSDHSGQQLAAAFDAFSFREQMLLHVALSASEAAALQAPADEPSFSPG